MQDTAIFTSVKRDINFHIKCDLFIISVQKIISGCHACSKNCLILTVLLTKADIKRIMYNPVNPSFTTLKGVHGGS